MRREYGESFKKHFECGVPREDVQNYSEQRPCSVAGVPTKMIQSAPCLLFRIVLFYDQVDSKKRVRNRFLGIFEV